MINTTNYICWDLETGSADPLSTFPIEIAAQVYDARSLEAVSGAGFSSLCKPPAEFKIEDGALEVNKIKREDIEKAPPISIVWPQFIDWINKYNRKKNKWETPIGIGMNIKGFDNIIGHRMNELYCPKKKDTLWLSTFRCVDLLDYLFAYFENSNEIPNYKMDTIREYMGIKVENAHRAGSDVEVTGAIIMRFLKYHRNVMSANPEKFKNCFKGVKFE